MTLQKEIKKIMDEDFKDKGWDEVIFTAVMTDGTKYELTMRDHIKQVFSTQIKRIIKKMVEEVVPKKKKTCNCEDGFLGYHTKDCDFVPYGFNEAVDQITENIKNYMEEL
jgi:hypothetical protein